MADWLDEIRYRRDQGQTIFALNGAGKWLAERGITAAYTVILDARAQNVDFVGHSPAYMLASQCHPSVIEAAGSAWLWHQHYPDNMAEFDAALPPDAPAHALIGGGTTVGLSAMALTYALGYRKLHLYGYDSSFRGEAGHAYPQSDPQAVVCESTVAGRTFRTTLSMAQQAELFPLLADQLIDGGCLITMRGDGLLPWTAKMSGPLSEADKYRALWDLPQYREFSPGEHAAAVFSLAANPSGSVIDFGAGTGRGALRVRQLRNIPVHMVDFAENCLDPAVRALLGPDFTFEVHDLAEPLARRAEFGYCTDVMEHIPPEQLDTVLQNILAAASRVFFQIATVPDAMGELIGRPLHLTVQPAAWWREKLAALGSIRWESATDSTASFLVSTT